MEKKINDLLVVFVSAYENIIGSKVVQVSSIPTNNGMQVRIETNSYCHRITVMGHFARRHMIVGPKDRLVVDVLEEGCINNVDRNLLNNLVAELIKENRWLIVSRSGILCA